MRTQRFSIPLAGIFAPIVAASLLCPAGSPRAAAADHEIALKTTIVSATVYSDRAQVTRSGRAELRAGVWKLVCDDLPQKFDEMSLQISGTGTAETHITGIDIATLRGRLADSPRYQELKEKLEELSGRRDTLRIELGAHESSLAYIEKLAAFPFEKGSSKLATEIFRVQDWKGVIEFLGAERVKTNERIDGHNKKIARLNEEIEWIEKQMRDMQIQEDWSKRVVIDLEAMTAGSLDLELVYNVPGASWMPEYTIRYQTESEVIAIAYNARIRQSTGEDWNGVAVALSTAQPLIGAAAPEVQPYYITRRIPRIRKAVGDELKVRGGRDEAVQLDLAAPEAVPAQVFEAERPGAELETTAFAASFSIPKRIDLMSGDDPKRALILEGALSGALSHYAAPRLSKNIFARGKITNSLAVPLLPGTADVYVETGTGKAKRSTFVGKESLAGVAANQDFSIFLGADQDFKITHNLEKREYLAKEGAATKKIRYHYLATVESFKKEPVEVKIQDRIPVSTLKEVRVTNVDLDPKPAEMLENGVVTWNLVPQPKAKLEVRIVYTIEFPGDWDEIMLNLE
jgi:uncharacterized protein (TIGR02231 family)